MSIITNASSCALDLTEAKAVFGICVIFVCDVNEMPLLFLACHLMPRQYF